MCQGFAAIVGEPISVSALGAARRGATIDSEREAEGRSDETEGGGLEGENGTDLARREAGRLQQPDLTVLVAGAGADEDANDDEGNDQEQDGERRRDHLRGLCIPQRVIALVLPGLEAEIAGRHRCRRPLGERRSRRRIRQSKRLRPTPAGAIGFDAFERGGGDPGQAGIATGVARLAGYDRRPEHREVDRAAPARNCQRVTNLDAECIRKAAFEHDPVLAQRRAGGQHGQVHGRATTQAGEVHVIGTSPRANGRPYQRDRRAPFGNAG